MKTASAIPSLAQVGLQLCAPQVCSRMTRSTTMMRLVTAAGGPHPDRMLRRFLQTGCNQHQLLQQPQRQQHPREEVDRSQLLVKCPLIFRSVTDRYKGVHVSLDQLSTNCSISYFASLLNASLDSWTRSECSSVWLRVPIDKGHFIPEAAKFGFRFHHADNCHAVLCLWLRKDTFSRLPNYATHQVGVAGCVVHSETNQVLVVKDKMQSHPLWKFPGGLSDLGEDIGDTAKREVWEETGIRTNFNGILAFRQQHEHPDACGRSDLFYVCLLTPITFDLNPCKEEIAVCKWMLVDDLQQTGMVSAISKRSLQLVRHGMKNGFDKVTIHAEECKSIYKGKRMTLHSRSLDMKEDLDLGDYPHHITKGDQFD